MIYATKVYQIKFFTKNAIYLPNFVTLRYYTLIKL